MTIGLSSLNGAKLTSSFEHGGMQKRKLVQQSFIIKSLMFFGLLRICLAQSGYEKVCEEEIPYLVSIQLRNEQNPKEYVSFCPGVQVANRAILTVASCILPLVDQTLQADRVSDGKLKQGTFASLISTCHNIEILNERVQLTHYYLNPDNKQQQDIHFDIAVVELENETYIEDDMLLKLELIELDQESGQIRNNTSQSRPNENSDLYVARKVMRQNADEQQAKDTLLQKLKNNETIDSQMIDDQLAKPNYKLFPMEMYGKSECEQIASEQSRVFDFGRLDCGVSQEGEQCTIDKGYPIIQKDYRGQDILVGLFASYMSIYCGVEEAEAPFLFTEISSFYGWIVQVLDQLDQSNDAPQPKNHFPPTKNEQFPPTTIALITISILISFVVIIIFLKKLEFIIKANRVESQTSESTSQANAISSDVENGRYQTASASGDLNSTYRSRSPDNFVASSLENQEPNQDIENQVSGPLVTSQSFLSEDILTKLKTDLSESGLYIDFGREVTLTQEIGSGSFGSVYKEIWRQEGGQMKQVAVKAMKMSWYDTNISQSQIDLFMSEMNMMAGICSDYVVQLYGGSIIQQKFSIVMELMEGGNLAQYIRMQNASNPIPYKQTLLIGMQIAKGLSELHPDVVHRDLKPQNILLDGKGVVKIADFGLSRMKQGTYISTKGMKGTPAYMAPEVLRGGKGVSEKCDIYALGMILWECLTGKKPWEEYDIPIQIVHQVVNCKQRPCFPSNCSKVIKRIIEKCWEQESSRRLSAYEVGKRLQMELEREWGQESDYPQNLLLFPQAIRTSSNETSLSF